MTNAITQAFIPGPRLIDGSDLNNLVAQMNAAFVLAGAYPAATALNTVGAGTITAAGIVGGLTTRGGAQTGSAFTDTTDTAAAIISAMGSTLATGAAFFWFNQNNTNAQATLAAGATVTLSGNVVVPLLTWAAFLVTKTSSTAVSMAFVNAGSLVPLPVSKFAADTAQATTLTVAGLTGAQLVALSLTGTTPGVLGVGPTQAIVTATPNAAAGMSWQLTVANPSATTAQLSGLTNVTITPTATQKIPAATARTFNVSLDSLTSMTLTGITATTL